MTWGGGSDPGRLLLLVAGVFVILSPASCRRMGLCQDGRPSRFRDSILSPLAHHPLLVSALTHISKLSCVSATPSSWRSEK